MPDPICRLMTKAKQLRYVNDLGGLEGLADLEDVEGSKDSANATSSGEEVTALMAGFVPLWLSRGE